MRWKRYIPTWATQKVNTRAFGEQPQPRSRRGGTICLSRQVYPQSNKKKIRERNYSSILLFFNEHIYTGMNPLQRRDAKLLIPVGFNNNTIKWYIRHCDIEMVIAE